MPRTLAFHKPYGVLSSFTDPEGRPTLRKYIQVSGVYSAGRLDMDSEGLLLLSDDASVLHRLTDPRYEHPKTYLVQLEGVPDEEKMIPITTGIQLHGYQTLPAEFSMVPEPELVERAKPVTPHGPTFWIRLVLREGKKRQIRHMTAAVGYPTLRLVRVAIGPIHIGSLQPGEWRDLTPEEVSILAHSINRKPGQPGRKKSDKSSRT